jgi:ubiquinone/menaquinone biosynthesis C-methylase UbiE
MPPKRQTRGIVKINRIERLIMTFDLGRQIYLKGIVNDLQAISGFPPNKKMLEIGCGNGAGTKLIQRVFQPAEFVATELDESLVELAIANNIGSPVQIESGDATKLRFADNEFDAVIGLSVIHHIPNWTDCIDELHRVIKPGGMLIIKELSIETFESFFGRISRRFVDHPYADMFTKDEFLAYLQKRGFDMINCRPHSMMNLLTDFLLVARKTG